MNSVSGVTWRVCASHTGQGRPVAQEDQLRAQAIVEVMLALQDGRGTVLERENGARALDVALEIEAALMAQMEGNLGHVLLWEQFKRTPTEVDAALASVVDSLVSDDSVLAEWLAAARIRYQRACKEHAP